MSRMKVLLGCEFSGIVRDAFAARGHDAWSCDLRASERANGQHLQRDLLAVLADSPEQWDLLIVHPPCTHLAISGARYFKEKQADGRQQAAIEFAKKVWAAPVKKIAMEQPISILSTHIRKPDQIVHPWMFGHKYVNKATCLWLKNLKKLHPTNIVERKSAFHAVLRMAPGPNRERERSRTFIGIAEAMATQWG